MICADPGGMSAWRGGGGGEGLCLYPDARAPCLLKPFSPAEMWKVQKSVFISPPLLPNPSVEFPPHYCCIHPKINLSLHFGLLDFRVS